MSTETDPEASNQTEPDPTAPAEHPGRPDDEPDPRRWRALTVCLVAGFMTLLDVSIVNVALPSIREGVGANDSDLQWIISGYALTFGLVLVPSGRLGDARGRRTVFVVGVAIFTLSSLAAGLAPTPLLLVVARLAQGVGGGVLNPQVSGLIQELFRGAERGRAFGRLGSTIGISTAVGPLLGGAIISVLGPDVGWRWIFFVNLPVGALCIALAFWLLPAPQRHDRTDDLDPVGVALLGATVVALLLPLVQARQWPGPAKWWLVVLAVVLAVVFVLWERRHEHRGGTPVVDLQLFRLESYSAGALIALLYFSGFTSIFFVLTLFLQSGLGYSPLLAGLAVTPFAAGSAVSAVVGGRLVSSRGRPVVVAGLVVVVVGLALTDAVLTWRGTDPGIGWWIAGPLLLAGLGSGLVISPNITLTVSQVPVARAGSAGGVLQTGQRVGTAAGIAAIGSIFFATLASSRGDYTRAAVDGLRVTLVLVVIALAAGVLDVVVSRRRERAEG